MDDWTAVKISVWWRCCTIVIGVAISGSVCVLVLPVFAGDVAREALAEALRMAAQLLSGVTEVYLTVSSRCNFLAAASCLAPAGFAPHRSADAHDAP